MPITEDATESELIQRGRLCVEVSEPDLASYTVTLAGKDVVIVGRSHNADIQIDHRSVSRQHVRLRLRTTIDVEDLRSCNGTRVCGAVLEANRPTAITLGERIEIGSVAIKVLPERSGERPRGRRRRGSRTRALESPEGWLARTSPTMQTVLTSLERVADSK